MTKKTAAGPQPAAKSASTPAAASPALPASIAARLGNFGLSRALQAKLTVNHPDDPFEHEADRVADQVMRMPADGARIARSAEMQVQRACACQDELQRTEADSSVTPQIDSSLESSIAGLAGRGTPLPASVRSFMEPRFGADFSGVRVHADAQAQSLASAVEAKAFTVGQDVVFGAGHYAPETDTGKRLLAHELTHTLQQTGGLQRAPLPFGPAGSIRRESSMAEGFEAARAREDIERKHWGLPDMERCLGACHFSSPEARRWYAEHFLRLYYSSVLNEPLDGLQLEHLLVQYGVAEAPGLNIGQKFAAASGPIADYVRTINSKEYKIQQEPYEKRFEWALDRYKDQLLEAAHGPSLNNYASTPALPPPEALWKYGIANDLFVTADKSRVAADIAARAASTFKERLLYAQRLALVRREGTRPASPEKVWEVGVDYYLFLPEELPRVIEGRKAALRVIEADRAEKAKAIRHQAESDAYRAHVARGEQLWAAEPILQPFAFAAFGPLIGAAYGGTQTGLLAGETYNACVRGQGNCADAVFQIGVGVATHQLSKGLNGPRVKFRVRERLNEAPIRATEKPRTPFSDDEVTENDPFGPHQITEELDPKEADHVSDPKEIGIEELPHDPTPLPDPQPEQGPVPEPETIIIPEPPKNAAPRQRPQEQGQQPIGVRLARPGEAQPVPLPPRQVPHEQQQQQQLTKIRDPQEPRDTRRPTGDTVIPAGRLAEVPVPALVRNARLLGKGKYKHVYEHDGRALAIFDGPSESIRHMAEAEVRGLRKLAKLFSRSDLPKVNPGEVFEIEGRPAYYMDRFAEGSRDIVAKGQFEYEIVGESRYLNEASIRDLRMIKAVLEARKIFVDDLQFLITAEGRVTIADPGGVPSVGVEPPHPQHLKQIDLLIEAAERAIAKRNAGQ